MKTNIQKSHENKKKCENKYKENEPEVMQT